jgi:hypothetical protein
MQVFLSQFLRRPTHLQHIVFLFSVEKENSGENKKSKSCTHRAKQKHAPEKLAQS